jgi:hypothetical protein
MMTPQYNRVTATLDRSVGGYRFMNIAGSIKEGEEEINLLAKPILVVQLDGGYKFDTDNCLAVKNRGEEVNCRSCEVNLHCPIFQRLLEHAAAGAIITATVPPKKKRYPDKK